MRSVILAVVMFCAWGLGFAEEQCVIDNGKTYVALSKPGEQPQCGQKSIRKGKNYEVGKVKCDWISGNADRISWGSFQGAQIQQEV